jgi:streptomycin 6-kinase
MPNDPFQPWLERWGLTPDGPAFTSPMGSRLAPVIKDGAPAMLKLAAHEEERNGAKLMAWYAGQGAARVLAIEHEALLLERLTGERSLAEMARNGRDDEATRILSQAAGGLHAPRREPVPASLVPMDVWFRALEPAAALHGGTFAKSAVAARDLLSQPRDIVVLHGDFHHNNVLDGGARGWLAIDPKGVLGERGFEFANLFRNPDAEIALTPGRMRRQARIVAEEAGLELKRLFQWILAYAGLGAAWSIQMGHDPAPGLAIAEIAASELAGGGLID